MQYGRQPACSVISLFNYIPPPECGQIHASNSHCTSIALDPLIANQKKAEGAPPSICRVGLAFSGNIHAAPIHRNQFRNSARNISASKSIQHFFLGVEAPAVALPDNSGTGIQFFLPPSKPASARAAILRTNNPLQDCNSWLHRNERTAFPYHHSLLSARLYRPPAAIKNFQLISTPG